MSKAKRPRTTVTVRLTAEEYDVLTRLCALQKTTRTAYLTRVATCQAKQELLRYAAHEYRAGRSSLSALATRTGLDVPTIMEEIARITGEEPRAVESFVSAVETLAQLHHDPAFSALAKAALAQDLPEQAPEEIGPPRL
jgi:uncharacterized protein (DUF1778 family)